jgi:hypothetical protein
MRKPNASFAPRALTPIALILVLATLVGCHRSKHYEANVEITRVEQIRKDDHGVLLTSDAEFSYVECPGTQIEVIRGGKDFSACMQKYKVGEKVKVKVEHRWDPEGHWDYDVVELGGRAQPPDPNDEASYKLVRECSDWVVNGASVGFQCNYQSKKELNAKCPWFKKH